MSRIPRKIAGIGASDLPDAVAFDAYVGPAREITVDPQRGIIALHDNVTPGGHQFRSDFEAADYATAAQGAKADSALQSVVAGLNVFVDNTDPLNPVISATGGGGGGDVTGPSGATSGNIATFDGSTGKLVKDSGVNVSRLSNLTYRTPADFGAVGDGVSDDYSALVSCIQSGYPIDWGSQDKIYKIKTEINETVTHTISWRSSGATIRYDGTGAPRSTVTLKVYPLVHQIDGVITFDGNNKAHAGIYVTNAAGSITGSVYPSLIASHVRAINIYRSNISFGSSCGILIHGDFERVNLLHPYVKDVHGAVAAQNPSIAGISGITVTRGTTDYPRDIFIMNPHVENVFLSDSQAYGDQDGIVIFGFVGESSGSVANSYDAKVIGGTVKNVRGRSLKGQIRNSYIAGLNVIKEASVIYTSGGLLNNMGDIELQNGEGVVSGVTMTLNGVSCEDMIRVLAPDNVLSPPGIVSDVRAIVNLVTPRSAVMFSQRKNGTKNWFSASNVSIATGSVTYGVLIDDNSTSATGKTLCNLSGFVGKFGSAFVVGSNALVANGHINIVNVINATATVPAYSGNVGWTVNKQNTISLS